MDTLYYILSATSSALWVPILVKFYRSWSNRHNPVSLAICALITLIIWMAIAGIWILSGNISHELIVTCSAALSSSVAIVFHIAFYWSEHKFAGSRQQAE